MKPGTIVCLPDGRVGTVVYHSLDGYGIQWGRLEVNVDEINAGCGSIVGPAAPDNYRWRPEAMLRDPYPSADLECVGSEFTIESTEVTQ